jgi:trimeric autotransporter adhesin
MQHSVHNRATIRVADRTDVSCRLTADEVNLDRFHNRIGKVCALVAATLIVPALAYAQGNPIAKLEAQVDALQNTVTALQTQVNTLQTQLSTVQSNNALALGPFVSVDPNSENGVAGPNIKFTGANIHILSGSGTTDDNLLNGGSLTGLGNLIIGYDEVYVAFPRGTTGRGGSHNLVVGRFHNFTSVGGLIGGETNTINAAWASITGGNHNLVSQDLGSVSGGQDHTVSGFRASVSGGFSNTASGDGSSVSGGNGNTASGPFSSVSGGTQNTASGAYTSVTGGVNNTAFGLSSIVIGGTNITDNNNNSIAPHPPFP